MSSEAEVMQVCLVRSSFGEQAKGEKEAFKPEHTQEEECYCVFAIEEQLEEED